MEYIPLAAEHGSVPSSNVNPRRLRGVITRNIRRIAKEKRISLNKLADFAGIDRSGLYQVLRHDVALTTDRLCRIADALEVEPWTLLKTTDAEGE